MQKVEYLSDELIEQINDCCKRKGFSLLQLSYELKLSYPALLYGVKKERKMAQKSINIITEWLKRQDYID